MNENDPLAELRSYLTSLTSPDFERLDDGEKLEKFRKIVSLLEKEVDHKEDRNDFFLVTLALCKRLVVCFPEQYSRSDCTKILVSKSKDIELGSHLHELIGFLEELCKNATQYSRRDIFLTIGLSFRALMESPFKEYIESCTSPALSPPHPLLRFTVDGGENTLTTLLTTYIVPSFQCLFETKTNIEDEKRLLLIYELLIFLRSCCKIRTIPDVLRQKKLGRFLMDKVESWIVSEKESVQAILCQTMNLLLEMLYGVICDVSLGEDKLWLLAVNILKEEHSKIQTRYTALEFINWLSEERGFFNPDAQKQTDCSWNLTTNFIQLIIDEIKSKKSTEILNLELVVLSSIFKGLRAKTEEGVTRANLIKDDILSNKRFLEVLSEMTPCFETISVLSEIFNWHRLSPGDILQFFKMHIDVLSKPIDSRRPIGDIVFTILDFLSATMNTLKYSLVKSTKYKTCEIGEILQIFFNLILQNFSADIFSRNINGICSRICNVVSSAICLSDDFFSEDKKIPYVFREKVVISGLVKNLGIQILTFQRMVLGGKKFARESRKLRTNASSISVGDIPLPPSYVKLCELLMADMRLFIKLFESNVIKDIFAPNTGQNNYSFEEKMKVEWATKNYRIVAPFLLLTQTALRNSENSNDEINLPRNLLLTIQETVVNGLFSCTANTEVFSHSISEACWTHPFLLSIDIVYLLFKRISIFHKMVDEGEFAKNCVNSLYFAISNESSVLCKLIALVFLIWLGKKGIVKEKPEFFQAILNCIISMLKLGRAFTLVVTPVDFLLLNKLITEMLKIEEGLELRDIIYLCFSEGLRYLRHGEINQSPDFKVIEGIAEELNADSTNETLLVGAFTSVLSLYLSKELLSPSCVLESEHISRLIFRNRYLETAACDIEGLIFELAGDTLWDSIFMSILLDPATLFSAEQYEMRKKTLRKLLELRNDNLLHVDLLQKALNSPPFYWESEEEDPPEEVEEGESGGDGEGEETKEVKQP